MGDIAIIAFTEQGVATAKRVAAGLVLRASTCTIHAPERYATADVKAYTSLSEWTREHFATSCALVFVCASGIAVRAIAAFVRDKFTDPAVVCLDECGHFVISLVSGHVGGANELTRVIAKIVGGQPVVTTASDMHGLFAVDEWARTMGLQIIERDVAKEISMDLLDGKTVGFASDFTVEGDLPCGITYDDQVQVGFIVSLDDKSAPWPHTLHLVPRCVTVGVGCRKGLNPQVLQEAASRVLEREHLCPRAIAAVASIDLKSKEPAVLELADMFGAPVHFFSAKQLAAVEGEYTSSKFVEKICGVDNVCERAAVASGGRLFRRKCIFNGTSIALALHEPILHFYDNAQTTGG